MVSDAAIVSSNIDRSMNTLQGEVMSSDSEDEEEKQQEMPTNQNQQA